jgi:hypothetical protein
LFSGLGADGESLVIDGIIGIESAAGLVTVIIIKNNQPNNMSDLIITEKYIKKS